MVIGDWSDRAARNRPSSGRLEVAPPGKEHGARETRRLTPVPVGARKDTGARLEERHSWRPLSSVGCARSSAAGRLGAFLRSSPTGPGPAKSCVKRSGGFPTPTPTGGLKVPPPIRPTPAPPETSEGNRGEEGDKNVPPPDPARNWAGIVRQRRTPHCRCRTPRRGDPCGRPPRTAPPSAGHCLGTTEAGGWSGDFLVADWDRRPERRLSGADWDRRPSGRREWRRGAATQPENDATPQGTHKGCPYDHRGLEVSKKKEDRNVPGRGIDVYLELVVGSVSPPTALKASTDSCTVGSVAPAGAVG